MAVVAEHPERLVGSIDLPTEREPGRAAHPQPDPRRPARARRGVDLDRPDRLAGHRGRPAVDRRSSRRCAAGSPAAAAWSSPAGRSVRRPSRPSPTRCSRSVPVVTTDVPAANLTGLLGELPTGATTVPALSGELIAGRALATAGDRVVAAERPYGSGAVTLLGFDPSVDWIAKTDAAQDLWRRLLPAGTFGGLSFCDDNLLVGCGLAAAGAGAPADRRPDPHPARLHPAHRPDQLLRPRPARPPRVGVVHDARPHRRVRRRGVRVRCRPAWQRGRRQRGGRSSAARPGTTDGTAQVYLGVFSPTRGTYQVQRAGWRAPVGAAQRRLLRRQRARPTRSTSCRATRRASATSASGSRRCARSGPRPR